MSASPWKVEVRGNSEIKGERSLGCVMAETEIDTAMTPLQSAACTYRIAPG